MANDQSLIDYSLLHSQLSRSKLQSTNNSAYQTINSLIGGVKAFQDFVNTGFSSSAASQSAFANSINALINSILADISSIEDEITTITDQLLLLSFLVIALFEIDTTSAPQTFTLSTFYVKGFAIIKDYKGNALLNNITIIGTVDGVVNPVINTNYGIFRVYQSPIDNLYHEW